MCSSIEGSAFPMVLGDHPGLGVGVRGPVDVPVGGEVVERLVIPDEPDEGSSD